MGRGQAHSLVVAAGTHVREFFLPASVDVKISIARVLANHHPLIDGSPGWDEKDTALLQVKERIGDSSTLTVRHQCAVGTALNGALPGGIAVEQGVDDASTTGVGKEVRAKADQSTRRDGKLQAHPTRSGVVHLGHDAAAHRQKLRHHADVVLRDVYQEQLHRLLQLTIDLLGNDRGLGRLQLIPFAPHGFDQDSKLQLAPAHDTEGVRRVGLLDAQAHVLAQLGPQPFAQLSGRHELALAAGPRRGIHAEDHSDGRFVHPNRWQRLRCFTVGDRLADLNLLDTSDGHNVAGLGGLDFDPLEPLPTVELRHLAGHLRAIEATQGVEARSPQLAADNAADRQPPHVVAVIEVVGLELHGRGQVAERPRQSRDDEVKQRA